LANDVMVSFFSALTIFLVMRALEQENAIAKCRLWILAGVSLWVAFLAKVSALAIVPAIGVICWMNRRQLGATFIDFLVTSCLLFGITSVVFWLFTDDPIAPYHSEFMGHPVSADLFWTYPRWLFLPDQWGDFVYSWYPHLLLVLAVASLWLRMSISREVLAWLLFVFAALQLNVKLLDGAWFTAFRNVRHGHVLVYPLILLLTGYLVELRRKHPKVCDGAIGALLVFSLWQCTTTASKTQAAFADRRNACWFLAALPPKTLYADGGIHTWCTIIEGPAWKFESVRSPDPAGRRAELAAISSGYLVTGGGREPIYGPYAGTPRADEVPPEQWKLLKEFRGPEKPTPWRPEPVRIWEAAGAATER